MKNRMTRLTAAAVLVAGAFAAVNWFGWLSGGTVAWADVIERFRSVDFYSATVYIKEDATSEPKQVELWLSSSGKARVRTGSQLLFAEEGRITAGYDLRMRSVLGPEQYDAAAESMVGKLCNGHGLSLDTVVAMVHRGTLKEVTPVINRDAMISADMLVFDIESAATPEWMRIWALRESRLPIRLRMWDPRDGECIEAVFTYSSEQPAEFFDSERLEDLMRTSLTTGRGAANLAYAFLRDAGGRDYAPKDLFARSGYHVPTVDEVGVTEYGSVWVITSNSENRRPDGGVFYGFGVVQDDLGRAYRRIASTWRIDDVSVQVFVPEDYPFDPRRPEKLTLICEVEKHHPDEAKETIGRVEVTDLVKGRLWPTERLKDSEYDIMLKRAWEPVAAARYKPGAADYGICDRIIDLIQKSDEAAAYAHAICRIRLAILINEKQFDQANMLAEQVWGVEFERFLYPGKASPSFEHLWDCILGVAGAGRIDRSAEMVKQLKESTPDLSGFSAPARRHFSEALPKWFADQIGHQLVSGLFSKANLSLEEVNRIVGFDVLKNDDTKWDVPPAIQQQSSPDVIAWNQHLEELAAYYRLHPLDRGGMELRKRDGVYNGISNFTPPGLDEYRVWPIDGSLEHCVRTYKYQSSRGRIRIRGQIPKVRLQHDLVSREPVDENAAAKFVLSQFGLEVVEEEDACEVWIAEYDGRALKDYRDVRPPRTEGAATEPGMPKYMTSHGITVANLLALLAEDQDVVLENATEIGPDIKLSGVAPNFKGEAGETLARGWFKDNFGITFRKERRTMPVYVVQSK